MDSFLKRMILAAKCDVGFYEDVEGDVSALKQAMTVVVLSGIAAGIGSFSEGGVNGLISGTVGAIAGWFIWSYVTFFIGTKLMPEPQTFSSYGELLRTIGFSSSPGVIRVFGILPGLHAIVFAVTGVWMLAAMIVAVRQALDYRSTWRAVAVVFIGWLLYVAVYAALALLFHR